MEDISVLQKSQTYTDRFVRNNITIADFLPGRIESEQLTKCQITEGDENFLTYLDWHGLANEKKMIVLSSKLHYYYDYEDFTGVTTVINLKKLNFIKNLKGFIYNVHNMLPPNTNFVGCFFNRNSKNGFGSTSKMYRRFINFLDSKVEIKLDSHSVSNLFISAGFRIIDMTEIDGLTYFRVQNLKN